MVKMKRPSPVHETYAHKDNNTKGVIEGIQKVKMQKYKQRQQSWANKHTKIMYTGELQAGQQR